MMTRIYKRLLRLYPARFREEYGAEMERQFRDEDREARGGHQRTFLWLHALQDLITTVPVQRTREFVSDLKHALRLYRSRKLTTLLAVSALALAIGAATGIFSVLNAMLLRGLPFQDAGRLVELCLSPFNALKGRNTFYAWSHHSSYLQSAATFSRSEMNLSRETRNFRVKVAETSANLFAVLGVQTHFGRSFSPNEDVPGQNAVAVISYGLWQQFYGGDPAALGATLHLNGNPFTIIGVAPVRFDYPGGTNIWVPTAFDIEKIPKRGAFLFQTIGRLQPGVSFRSTEQMFEGEIRRATPRGVARDTQNQPRLVAIRNQLAGPVRKAGWALAAMVFLLVIAACANVAHLLLARAGERRSELAVRAALGASRARLSQQLVTEASALTVLSAMLGLFIAHWISRVANSFLPPALASQSYAVADWRVLGFAAALALATGIVLGAIPARSTGRSLAEALRTQPGTAIVPARRTRALLVALQTCLALVLIFGALTLGGAFLRLSRADLGFRTTNVVTASVSLAGADLPGPASEWQCYTEALNRLRSIPGIEAAGAASHLPLANEVYMALAFKLDTGQRVEPVIVNASMPGYFKAIGTRVIAGRDFTFHDELDRERPVVVNEAFAKKSGLGTVVLGRHIRAPWTSRPYVVIGITADQKFAGPEEDTAEPQIFWPIQEEPPAALTFVARVGNNPNAYLVRCRDAIRSVNPRVAVYDVKSLDERRAEVLAKPRFYTTATLFLALLAVLLAADGIYGTSLYSIVQRKHEMGVRMALGASYGNLRVALLREGLFPVMAGLLCGIPAAMASTRIVMHFLFEAQQPAIAIVADAAGLMFAIAVFAAWRAGARVLSIDPLEAIRAE